MKLRHVMYVLLCLLKNGQPLSVPPRNRKTEKPPTGTPLEAFCSRLPVKGLAAAIIPQDRSPNTREMYCGLYMAGSE